jgi:hypothetical protein
LITGFLNRVVALSTRFTPTPVLLAIAASLNRGRAGGAN